MLMPHERSQAIQILTSTYVNSGNLSYGGQPYKDMLMYGHKGFAEYTDHELLRAMQSLAKKSNSHEIVSFIQNIAVDKFVLE